MPDIVNVFDSNDDQNNKKREEGVDRRLLSDFLISTMI